MSNNTKETSANALSISRRQFAVGSLTLGAGLATGLTASLATAGKNSAAAASPEPTAVPALAKDSVDVSRVFAKHFVTAKFDDLPSDVVRITKMQILDTLGVAIAGVGAPGVVQLRDLIVGWGGKPEAHLFGSKNQVPAHDAAQVNTSTAHALDYDDVHELSYSHPAIINVPTAFTAAEQMGGISGEDLLLAVALGVDVMCRMAMAGQPGVPPLDVGWHSTTLYGYPTAALTAGKILGLNEEQLAHAVGIAYHQAAGNAQTHLDGALTKRLGPGFAVRAGYMAARLARKGVTGATRSLEGAKGLYQLYHKGHYDRSILVDKLGQHFEGANVSFKRYPACRSAHPSIDAAMNLASRHKINPAHIDEIVVINGPGQYHLLSTPLDIKTAPRTLVDAQFSIPWTVSVALVNHQVVIGDFTADAITNQEVLAVAAKVRAELDPEMTRPGGGVEPARVDVVMKDGRRFSDTVQFASGSPQSPMSFNDCADKFADCARSVGVAEDMIKRVIAQVADLEKLKDATALIRLLA